MLMVTFRQIEMDVDDANGFCTLQRQQFADVWPEQEIMHASWAISYCFTK